MPHIQCSEAALRIVGDDLVPEEITRLLGCPATSSQIKGQELGKNSASVRIAKTGMWLLESTSREPEDLNGQITELLGKLSVPPDIWSEMSRKYKIDLFCGLFMEGGDEGLSISPRSLAALGSRGIELELCIYGPLNEEDPAPEAQ